MPPSCPPAPPLPARRTGAADRAVAPAFEGIPAPPRSRPAADLVRCRRGIPMHAGARSPARPRRLPRFLDRIPNHARRVPVPRRILRLLAGGCRPAMIATILGHLFRCLYVKGGVFQDLGPRQGVVDRRHLRRRPAPRQGGAAGTDRHGMAHPPALAAMGDEPLGRPRPHQPGLVEAGRHGAGRRTLPRRGPRVAWPTCCPARYWHPLPRFRHRNRHPLILLTRNP